MNRRNKICIVWLISLFAWNAVFGAFGGFSLCIHENLGVHVDDDLASASCGSCGNAHTSERADTCLTEDESCVDIELVAERLPAMRLNSVASTLPQVMLAAFIECGRMLIPALAIVHDSSAPHAPPNGQMYWLTDLVLPTTVLRV